MNISMSSEAAVATSGKEREASASDLFSKSAWLRRVATWDDAQADARIRQGLPVDLAVHLQELLELTDDEAAHLIGRSRSTYARYRNKDKTLGTAEAERAVRFAQLLLLAAETFGSLEEARSWMRESNHALGGRAPFDMAETDPGARVVSDLLLGLQHGHPV